MNETMKIDLKGVVPLVKKAKSTGIPDDFIEIISKYISIYHGCWIRYTVKETGESYPGGFLIENDDGIVTLRNIKRDVFELRIRDHIFFCKSGTPHHTAVKAIVEEYDRLSIKIREFNVERQKFLKRRMGEIGDN